MKKKIGLALLALIVVTVSYMVYQEFNTDKKITSDKIKVDESNGLKRKKDIVVDEQSLALEELQRSVGKSGLSKLYIVKCSACHGKDGKGTVGESIAGKSFEYNMSALMKYKKGEVPNTLMKGILENTSDEELKLLAEEISTFK